MSPDVFLSRNGVRYDGTGLDGTPAEIVNNLITLNNTRIWAGHMAGELEYLCYQTPNFQPAPINPNTFSRKKIQEEAEAVRHYYEVLKFGNLPMTHAAVDKINYIRAAKGGSEFIPVPDFEILGNGNGLIGYAARWLRKIQWCRYQQSTLVFHPRSL